MERVGCKSARFVRVDVALSEFTEELSEMKGCCGREVVVMVVKSKSGAADWGPWENGRSTHVIVNAPT